MGLYSKLMEETPEETKARLNCKTKGRTRIESSPKFIFCF